MHSADQHDLHSPVVSGTLSKHTELDELPGNGPHVVIRYRWWTWCGRRWFERSSIEWSKWQADCR
jgi:hypothetical protein